MAFIKSISELNDLVNMTDFSKINFQLDELQNQLIFRYLQDDMNFRRAFSTNYTSFFLKYVHDKHRLREPISLSILGAVRTSKSTSAITIAALKRMLDDKRIEAYNVCESQYEYLENLKMSEKDDIFVIDEGKSATFGVGSMARKMQLQDVQNIIAVNNISTIWIRPDRWSFEGADYGLRTFGRAFDSTPRWARLMLYNLSSGAGELPLGMIYIPHYADILEDGSRIDTFYRAKKQAWVDKEQVGQGDAMQKFKLGKAKEFISMPKFINLKKAERIAFISIKLGSNFTKTECEELGLICKMLLDGNISDDVINDANGIVASPIKPAKIISKQKGNIR